MRLFRRGRIELSVLLGSWLLALSAASQTPSNTSSKPFPVGEIIDSVACASDPEQSYALYLPSNYTPAKTWPIIYAFDPLAYGKTPVKLYKDAAEKYGFIVTGSNNSRNFSHEATTKTTSIQSQSTPHRFSPPPPPPYLPT